VISPAPPPPLRLIRGALDATGWTPFDGLGTFAPGGEPASAPAAWGRYAMGMPAEKAAHASPSHDDAFLVIDSLLRVRFVSERAATLLGEKEEDMVDRPVAKFLGPADAEARDPENFLHLLRRASTDGDEHSSVFVRPRNAFGVRMVARIAPCGPPGAALVLLRTRALRVEIHHGRNR
jgi:PAS domain-containing protein